MEIDKEAKIEKLIKIVSVFGIAFCCLLLFPQARIFIIEIGEKILGRSLNFNKFLKVIIWYSLFGILLFCSILISTIKAVQWLSEKYGNKIFILCSIFIVILSIIVRIVMYIKSRSLWGDEAALAESIVSRNWFELLIPPLSNMQSAPFLYVIVVKAICSIIGYSEFSLRVFSLFAFICFLISETILLKKVLKFNNFKISLVVTISTLLPSYIFYSNEFKPYLNDALFVILTMLTYHYYTQGKIKLPVLTILYILFLGFSTPSIFFIGGVIFLEFLFAIFNKNKKKILSTAISGIVVIAVFGLYYYWWMLPVLEPMKEYWDRSFSLQKSIVDILTIFSPGKGNSDSFFVMIFVPFALMGLYLLSKDKDKIALSVVLSLLFAFLASAIGYWPMTGRLWLFLPAIVLIFSPIGIDHFHDKINCKRITYTMEFCIFTTMIIFLAINCIGYTGDKMYYINEEINPLIYYVQRNIKEDEKLYVYPYAKTAFEFKNGYNISKIGNTEKDNIVYGKNRHEWNESVLGNELQLILENKKIYLIFSHHKATGINIGNGLEVLQNYGTLTKVMEVYDTPLYYFERED